MGQKTTKILIISSGLTSAALLILACLAIWLASGSLTPAKIKVLQTVPYPLALVNGRRVPIKEFALRQATTQKMGNTAAGNAIYNQLINEEKIRQVASARNLFVNQKEVEAEYKVRALQSGFGQQLNSYGLASQDFKNQVIKPALLLVKLQVWFYSQRNLNPDIYKLADSLTQKAGQGENIAELAAAFTNDGVGKVTGGDLGFVDSVNLLPELREPIESLKIGDISILASRFGLHIIKKEALNANKAHLRQIFLNNDGFDKWLYNETSRLKVWNLVKI